MPKLAVVQPTNATQFATSLVELAGAVSESTPLYVISSRAVPTELSFLQASGFRDPATEDPQQMRRLKSIWSAVRWLSVDSPEFRLLFDDERGTPNSSITNLAEKWSSVDVVH
jgi:hypothetical protein